MLIAFRDTKITKPAILTQLRAHAKADEFVKGQYWQGGKGCAVGCTIHSGDHEEYESRFGIPQMLAQFEDTIFEGLPNGKAKKWPVRFISAVQPGTDLSRVGWKFLHWLLTDETVNPGINHPTVRDAIKQCADVLVPLTKGLPVDASAARSAVESAESAARSAASAAWSAACAARSAASAAWSAAWSAASAARSAASAERSAESAESAASAARSAASAARSAASAESAASAAYIRMSNKLVALIKAAPKAKDKTEGCFVAENAR